MRDNARNGSRAPPPPPAAEGRDRRPRSPPEQPEGSRRRPSPARAHRRHRRERLRQVVTRVRHGVRRRAAPLRRDLLALRPPVPRSHGSAPRRPHRRHSARRRGRPDQPGPDVALHGGHHDRDQRLPEAPLRAPRAAPLPGVRGGGAARQARRASPTACWPRRPASGRSSGSGFGCPTVSPRRRSESTSRGRATPGSRGRRAAHRTAHRAGRRQRRRRRAGRRGTRPRRRKRNEHRERTRRRFPERARAGSGRRTGSGRRRGAG